jgi:uncharacterized protein YfeS
LFKKHQFGWSDQAQKAFEALKEAMSSTHMLALPDFTEQFIIETVLKDKYPSTIRKHTDPTPFSPRDSQGFCQSAKQGDYKRSIYLHTLTTQILTTIILENN